MVKHTDEQLAAWNEAHPVGTAVLAWPGTRDEAPEHTYVAHAATRWSWGECMANVQGWGNMALTHLEKSALEPTEHALRYRQNVFKKYISSGLGVALEVKEKVEGYLPTLSADTSLLEALPDEHLPWSRDLVELALWQQVRELADSRISLGVSSLVRRSATLGLPRPMAFDHRQRVRHLFKPAQLPAVREELAAWLLGVPAKQPFKPEIMAEEPVPGLNLVWVTFAVQDAKEALALGMNLARLEQEGGPASG